MSRPLAVVRRAILAGLGRELSGRGAGSRARIGMVAFAVGGCGVEGRGGVTDVLAGIRVLDFGRYIAGPYCAALLADSGAAVIRIQRRGAVGGWGRAGLGAWGTRAARMARQKTGRGQKVEGALLRTALAFNNPALVEQQVIRANRVATLNRGQTAAPSDLFRTQDGWIIAYAIGNPMFARWARLMGEERWLNDPRFKDDEARGAHGAIISKRMSGWTAARPTAKALEALGAATAPAGARPSPPAAPDDP